MIKSFDRWSALWLSLTFFGAFLRPTFTKAKSADAKNAGAKKAVHNAMTEQETDFMNLVVAVCQATNDYGNAIPPLDSKTLSPYLHNDSYFSNSKTGKAYLANAAVTGTKEAKLKGKQVVLFYEGQPARNGRRWVLFLPQVNAKGIYDLTGSHQSYIKQVSRKEWKKLSRQIKH